jgi:2-C-methyl-D-erythritol 2,4-cyclodiphosphate synthase
VKIRVGLGYDVHPFSGDGPLVLGGVTIRDDGTGLGGHSDADAVVHAVSDAILGPAGLPDLGTLFPASDDGLRGISSLELLRDVVARVAQAGWWVSNVDVVIAAERPTLGPHVEEMASTLRAVLEAAREPLGAGVFVSVRPKRGEGIGSIGRGEGIAVWAVALLEHS